MLLASEGVVALGRLSQERCGVLKRPQSGLGGLGMAIGGGGGGGGEGGSGVMSLCKTHVVERLCCRRRENGRNAKQRERSVRACRALPLKPSRSRLTVPPASPTSKMKS